MLARNQARLAALAASQDQTYACDVIDSTALAQTIKQINKDLNAPAIVIHNAVGGVFGSYLAIDSAAFVHNFAVNALALLHWARLIALAMLERRAGVILYTGNTSAYRRIPRPTGEYLGLPENTSAYRGKARFAGFAPTKATQRILWQSIARESGPKGIRAADIGIDATIDLA